MIERYLLGRDELRIIMVLVDGEVGPITLSALISQIGSGASGSRVSERKGRDGGGSPDGPTGDQSSASCPKRRIGRHAGCDEVIDRAYQF